MNWNHFLVPTNIFLWVKKCSCNFYNLPLPNSKNRDEKVDWGDCNADCGATGNVSTVRSVCLLNPICQLLSV